MKHRSALTIMVPLIGALALAAAAMGLFDQTAGQPYPLTSFRGEQVQINGHGLYFYDTVSGAAQMRGNDLVTILVAVPLLLGSFTLAMRGSLRGRLILTGTLGYTLYTYASMVFGTAYNALFLVYVALFGLSLFGFILSLDSFDVAALPRHFSPRLPWRGIAGLFFATGGFLLLAWLGRIVPPLLAGETPPLENVTSLFIQGLDLGVIVPAAFVTGVLVLRRKPWGFLLAAVMVMKFLTLGLAVSMMGVTMALAGVKVGPIELGVFPLLTLVNAVFAGLLLKHTHAGSEAPAPRRRARPAH
jgi:hypothetical protein